MSSPYYVRQPVNQSNNPYLSASPSQVQAPVAQSRIVSSQPSMLQDYSGLSADARMDTSKSIHYLASNFVQNVDALVKT